VSEIDTFNKFLVAAGGDNIVFLKPVPQNISGDDALLLAAYLVSMATALPKQHSFAEVLAAVENS